MNRSITLQSDRLVGLMLISIEESECLRFGFEQILK